MKAEDPRRCVFEHAATLKSDGEAPLTLTSHPGLAVIDMWAPDRQAGEWTYVELAIGDASAALRIRRKGNFLMRPDGKVLDVSMWQYMEGNNLVAVIHTAGQAKQTFKGGGGRDFTINDNGTISPSHASHLVVGLEGQTRLDCWDDDPPGFSAEGGTWTKFYSAPSVGTAKGLAYMLTPDRCWRWQT